MSTTHTVHKLPESNDTTEFLQTSRLRKRSGWRQRLVDAERGISLGIRMDSTLFVHFFLGCVILAAGLVLRVSYTQWALIALALTLAVSSELFLLVLRAISRAVDPDQAHDIERALRIGTAGVVVALLGATLTIGLVFATQLQSAFGG